MKSASPFALVLALASSIALAGPTNRAPEPGSFELLVLGGVVAAVIAFRNRKK
ncbi:MAG: PEP-CTERM sorting domain-containing protein [Acidobacteriota bacterium]|jgi:hypothetical protein